jgi:hypothetical protein
MYKHVIYLLSGSDNIYTEAYSLKEAESVRYFSIGCGGSLSDNEAVTVTLEHDTVLLDKYNKSTFDIDVSSYAKLLPENRYEIASYTVSLSENSSDGYVKVPVKVNPLGLSPDTIYFVPIAIKSVSKYEVNPEKYNLLYRVTIENDYAEQRTVTNYTKKGTEINQSSNESSMLSGVKVVQPLTKDKVRMFAGHYSQTQSTKVDDIERYAVVVQVGADNAVSITPYGTIDVEPLATENYNRYSIEKNIVTGEDEYYFYLYYRYRTVMPPVPFDNVSPTVAENLPGIVEAETSKEGYVPQYYAPWAAAGEVFGDNWFINIPRGTSATYSVNVLDAGMYDFRFEVCNWAASNLTLYIDDIAVGNTAVPVTDAVHVDYVNMNDIPLTTGLHTVRVGVTNQFSLDKFSITYNHSVTNLKSYSDWMEVKEILKRVEN